MTHTTDPGSCGPGDIDSFPTGEAEARIRRLNAELQSKLEALEMQNQAMGNALRECADWMRKEQAYQGNDGQCLQLDAALAAAEAALILWEPLQPREEEPPETDTVTLVIERIAFNGKWAEIWTDGAEFWAHSCKQSQLVALVVSANLDERVLNHGYVGLEVVWKRIGGNLEPIRIQLPKHEMEGLS